MTTRVPVPKATTTDLHRAALVGDLATVQRLLRSGHAIDPRDAEGCTPFLLACKQSEPEIFQVLRLAGAEIDATNCRGMSALFIVASTGVLSLARTLIKLGAEVNRPAARGLTPLIAAVMSENPYLVQLLLSQGANRRHIDATGVSVLKWARQVGNQEIVELIRCRDQSLGDEERNAAALHRAARTGDVALIRDCLSASVSVESRDDDGFTPLMLAARQGKRAAIETLLENGADPFRVARNGLSSILLAASSPIAIRPFVAFGVDLNRGAGQRQMTPLIFAARHGFGSVIQFLLDAGANPDRTDSEGLTAHDHAIANGHQRSARLLAEASRSSVIGGHEIKFRTTLPA